jgi:protein gp37
MRIASRLGRVGGKTGVRYAGLTTMTRSGPLWTGEIRVAEDLLVWPLTQRQPRRIAVNRMSDLFHENLATDTVDLLHAVMWAAHWHQFLLLSKRSRRMRDYYNDPETPHRIAEKFRALSPIAARGRSSSPYANPPVNTAGSVPWPLPNLWLGVSVEDQERIERVADLLQSPAAIRWTCFEPLLNRVSPEAVPIGDRYFDALSGRHYAIDARGRRYAVAGPAWRPLDWVVIGGEIGAGARIMQPDWVRILRDKCVASEFRCSSVSGVSGLRRRRADLVKWSASENALPGVSSMVVHGMRYGRRPDRRRLWAASVIGTSRQRVPC